MTVSRHYSKNFDVKAAIFLNVIGSEAVDLFGTFNLKDADRMDYEKLLASF